MFEQQHHYILRHHHHQYPGNDNTGVGRVWVRAILRTSKICFLHSIIFVPNPPLFRSYRTIFTRALFFAPMEGAGMRWVEELGVIRLI